MRLRHICGVCGKEEILTPEEAYDQGWDYPPYMGQFKFISPRTCGMDGTLWSLQGKHPDDLDEKQQQTLERILNEPESIMVTD